jgi:hypothetical protein
MGGDWLREPLAALVRITCIAFGWIGATTAFGVDNEIAGALPDLSRGSPEELASASAADLRSRA